MKNKVTRGITVGCIVFALTLILHNLGFFRSLEWKSWDLRLRLFSRPSQASKDIVLFFIDQESLDIYEKEQGVSWPWPRQIYSAVIRYLKYGGAEAVLLDLTLTESSVYGVEDDQDLAAAIAEAGNIFLPVFLSQKKKETEEASLSLLRKFSIEKERVPPEAIFPANSVTLPLENLLDSSRGVGNVNFSPDKDGIYRRIPLVFDYEDLIFPSLPSALIDFVKEKPRIHNIPLDESGQMIIRFYGPTGTYQSYSIAAIVNSFFQMEEGKPPQIPPEEFAGKIVFVGTSAPGLYDLRPTPFSNVYPGVEIQATVVDNLLHENYIRLPSGIVFVALLLFFSLLSGIAVSLLQSTWKIALSTLLCLALPVAVASISFFLSYWQEFVAYEFAILLSFIGASLLNYRFEGRQRRFIKSVFRYYLNPHIIERIIENPSLLRLGGEKREITSFFSDLAGFTSISESLPPDELVDLLNAYLSEMTDIILCFGGTLDKYEGDAIIAFWNAPLDQPDHALRACRAALRCQERLKELRNDIRDNFGHELYMRIGVNSGLAVVGNMGSQNRFDYTAMGDTVNLASRLEGACKQYELPILVGEATFVKIKYTIVAREVDLIRVVGKRQPVRIYEIIGKEGKISASRLEKVANFNQAIEAYKCQEWDKALSLFQELGSDILAQKYIARCKRLKRSALPEDWDGVFELKVK